MNAFAKFNVLHVCTCTCRPNEGPPKIETFNTKCQTNHCVVVMVSAEHISLTIIDMLCYPQIRTLNDTLTKLALYCCKTC